MEFKLNELATIVAGLRTLQKVYSSPDGGVLEDILKLQFPLHFHYVEPPNNEGIDELCHKLVYESPLRNYVDNTGDKKIDSSSAWVCPECGNYQRVDPGSLAEAGTPMCSHCNAEALMVLYDGSAPVFCCKDCCQFTVLTWQLDGTDHFCKECAGPNLLKLTTSQLLAYVEKIENTALRDEIRGSQRRYVTTIQEAICDWIRNTKPCV